MNKVFCFVVLLHCYQKVSLSESSSSISLTPTNIIIVEGGKFPLIKAVASNPTSCSWHLDMVRGFYQTTFTPHCRPVNSAKYSITCDDTKPNTVESTLNITRFFDNPFKVVILCDFRASGKATLENQTVDIIVQSKDIILSPSPNQAIGSNVSVTIAKPTSGALYLNHELVNHTLAVYTTSGSLWICYQNHLKHVLRRCDEKNGVTMFFDVQSNFSFLFYVSAQVKFNVIDCKNKTSAYGPKIIATGFTYNTPGQFVCPAGQELFYSNSTPGITNTICQNDATWFGAKGLECWGASIPRLLGNFSGMERTSVEINCLYNDSIYPVGSEYRIKVNGILQGTHPLNQAITLNLTREMNGKTIQCQAITKYTEVRPDKGWSQPHTLNVTYSPYLFGHYTCIGNQPCNITLSCNPSPHEANLMTGNESKPVTWIKQYNSTHVVQINEPAGNYKLLVSNSVGQTSVSVVISATNTNPPPGTNSALIIGIAVAGVVVVIGVIIFAALAWMRKRKTKPGKDSVEFKKSEAVYVNTQVYENTEAQQNTPEYQNIHGTDNTGNVEKAHLYEVPITLHSKPNNS